jgi:hypothetical protein
MSRPAPQIRLSAEEQETLLGWMRSSKTERRRVERARVILLAASGLNGKEIALKMKTRPARVSKWLRRFAKERIAALNDSPRSGEKRRKYTSATEERILKVLDEAPRPVIAAGGQADCKAFKRCESASGLALDRLINSLAMPMAKQRPPDQSLFLDACSCIHPDG